MNKDHPNENRDYLLGACSGKGVSHNHLCLTKSQRQQESRKVLKLKKKKESVSSTLIGLKNSNFLNGETENGLHRNGTSYETV